MPVTRVKSEAELTSALAATTNPVFVIKFTASWCSPCKAIAPVYSNLSSAHSPTLLFFEVDVDELREFAQAHRVRAMPTFVFYKSNLNTELDRIQGADQGKLTSKVNELAAKYKQSFTGQGHVLGGSSTHVNAGNPSKSSLSEEEIVQIAKAGLCTDGGVVCRVAVRFTGGVAGINKANLMISGNESVSKLRDFVDSILDVTVGKSSYELHNSYPPKKLDENLSVNDAGISGSMIVVKFK